MLLISIKKHAMVLRKGITKSYSGKDGQLGVIIFLYVI